MNNDKIIHKILGAGRHVCYHPFDYGRRLAETIVLTIKVTEVRDGNVNVWVKDAKMHGYGPLLSTLYRGGWRAHIEETITKYVNKRVHTYLSKRFNCPLNLHIHWPRK
jgi:hypothetical protein